mmetsp:Transcript_58178/g.186911  ORF Transcript_58178/g.186911 Transcript_58178/m.186911 type:complete len:225 (+) Transcript_58178:557-1231(+)
MPCPELRHGREGTSRVRSGARERKAARGRRFSVRSAVRCSVRGGELRLLDAVVCRECCGQPRSPEVVLLVHGREDAGVGRDPGAPRKQVQLHEEGRGVVRAGAGEQPLEQAGAVGSRARGRVPHRTGALSAGVAGGVGGVRQAACVLIQASHRPAPLAMAAHGRETHHLSAGVVPQEVQSVAHCRGVLRRPPPGEGANQQHPSVLRSPGERRGLEGWQATIAAR